MPHNLISKYRTELMGLAIIWIYLFHSGIDFEDTFTSCFFTFLKDAGYGGVDLFFFLSGFGLMQGMLKKKYYPLQFYKKRSLRILPTYWLVTSAVAAGQMIFRSEISRLGIFLLELTTVAFFFMGVRYDWFIASLMAFYLVFPLFFYCYQGISHKGSLIIAIVGSSLFLCALIIPSQLNYLLIFATRIPIFFIGAHVGYLSHEGRIKTTARIGWFFMICLAGAVASLIFIFSITSQDERWHYGLWWYPFIVGSYPICFFVAYILEKLSDDIGKNYFYAKMKGFLNFCGRYSLEIYLLHASIVFKIGEKIWPHLESQYSAIRTLNRGHIFEYLIYFAVTIALSVPLHRISISIQRLFKEPAEHAG
jgi:peptidoglycan/LPS O-acetylase OafA/YrhL